MSRLPRSAITVRKEARADLFFPSNLPPYPFVPLTTILPLLLTFATYVPDMMALFLFLLWTCFYVFLQCRWMKKLTGGFLCWELFCWMVPIDYFIRFDDFSTFMWFISDCYVFLLLFPIFQTWTHLKFTHLCLFVVSWTNKKPMFLLPVIFGLWFEWRQMVLCLSAWLLASSSSSTLSARCR